MRSRTGRLGVAVSAAPGLGLTLLTLAVSGGLYAGVTLAAAPAADAHNVLVSSSPADGATVTAPPAAVELVFDQAVQRDFGQVVVMDADEAPQQTGEPEIVGGTVTQPVGELTDGDYTVSYRIVSADGHPVSGSYTFTVAPALSDGTPPPDDASEPAAPTSSGSPGAEGGATDPASVSGDASDDASSGVSVGMVALVAGGALVIAALAFVAGGGRRRSPQDRASSGEGPQEDTEQQ